MDPSGTDIECQVLRRMLEQAPNDRLSDHTSQCVAPEAEAYDKNHHGWRRIVLNFTPSWFSVIMGTGISSILLHNLPYNNAWLQWISVVVFCLNVFLFVLFATISVLRYTMFGGLFGAMLRDPVQSLFLGTCPMGLGTIINMIVYVCVPIWGDRAAHAAWALWWIDAAIAVSTCFYLPFVIMQVHRSELSQMTALWLLPIVPTIVASASGSVVAEVLPNPQHALWTVITSYVLLGTGFPLAMVVMVMYFHRLTIYDLPPREVIVSSFVPVGPLGQGSFALMQLGKVAVKIFPITDTLMEGSGQTFYSLGHALALLLWGYGLIWLFFAVAGISRSKFPFNMGWWGFTFPLGIFAVSTTTLAEDLPSTFFRVLGTIFSLVVVLLWLGISLETARRAIRGDIFNAPCAKQYEKELAEKKIAKKAPGSVRVAVVVDAV